MEQCDYVDMPHNLAKVGDRVKEINIENILNTKGKTWQSTRKKLPHLPTK